MQTRFSPEQLAEPATAAAEKAIRTCVHCGFCLATCPTYVLLGDERDSPRGRIYLMKDMLENERAPSPEVVRHVDRCLSCLSCMSTCPSGVDYRHLVDHARAYIEDRYQRPWFDRTLRAALAWLMPYRGRFRAGLALAGLGRPFAPLFRQLGLKPLAAMLDLSKAPGRLLRAEAPSPAPLKGRVILLRGCVEAVLEPEFRAAAARLLARAGYQVVEVQGEGCCGSLTHHMGREASGHAFARHNIDLWSREIEAGGVDAILTTASGCGSTMKDYGFMFQADPAYAGKAKAVAAKTRDITEFLAEVGLPRPSAPKGLTVAYHAACSLQHGQRVRDVPKRLLAEAGFTVREPLESHLCCGSAGIYNITQPEIADQLRDRKVASLEATKPQVIASGNIGCLTQIGAGTGLPVVHTVQLLDWAHGGPNPLGG